MPKKSLFVCLAGRSLLGLIMLMSTPSWLWAQAAPAADATGEEIMTNTQRGIGWALVFFFAAIIVAILSKSANRDDRPKKLVN